MATWRYCLALLAFGKEGDTPDARRQLKEAISANRHVPAYLLGEEEIGVKPNSYIIGSPQEAVLCASECIDAWQVMPGAVDWLRAQSAKILPQRVRPRGSGKK
jgi:hypothetical protein